MVMLLLNLSRISPVSFLQLFYFSPTTTLGPHTVTVLFNRIPIPETPLRIYVESKLSEEPFKERKFNLKPDIE